MVDTKNLNQGTLPAGNNAFTSRVKAARGFPQSRDAPSSPKKRRKRVLTEDKRKERNAKEQARSNQLSQQFDNLRNLLTQAGIVVPKGTKVCVLSLAMDYIRMLQQNQTQDMEA